jgi:hypothetical protein
MVRVVDESGEDYLYSAKMFIAVPARFAHDLECNAMREQATFTLKLEPALHAEFIAAAAAEDRSGLLPRQPCRMSALSRTP